MCVHVRGRQVCCPRGCTPEGRRGGGRVGMCVRVKAGDACVPGGWERQGQEDGWYGLAGGVGGRCAAAAGVGRPLGVKTAIASVTQKAAFLPSSVPSLTPTHPPGRCPRCPSQSAAGGPRCAAGSGPTWGQWAGAVGRGSGQWAHLGMAWHGMAWQGVEGACWRRGYGCRWGTGWHGAKGVQRERGGCGPLGTARRQVRLRDGTAASSCTLPSLPPTIRPTWPP